MSEKILTNYPTFLPNQVLTDNQLNDLRDYLDQQNRLTRTRLSGTGIVCGLHTLFENKPEGEKPSLDPTGHKIIRVSAGLAITSGGYLVEVPEETIFGYYHEFSTEDEDGARDWKCKQDFNENGADKPVYELLAESGEGRSPLRQEIITDRVLILFLERTQEDRKSCAVTDCGNKGVNCIFNLRALLVPEECLIAEEVCAHKTGSVVKGTTTAQRLGNSSAETLKLIGQPLLMPRLHTAETLRLDPEGYSALSTIDSTLELRSAFGSIAKRMAVIVAQCLIETLDKIAYLSGQATIDNGSYPIQDRPNYFDIEYDRAKATIEKLYSDDPDSIFAREHHHYLQYHYDFVHDLLCAYNEFHKVWCELVKYCLPAKGFHQHVMLTGFSGGDENTYRTSFKASPIRDANHEYLQSGRSLFLRMLAMIEAFDADRMYSLGAVSKDFKEVRATPSQTGLHPLGKQAVPYYYRVLDDNQKSTAIVKYWQPQTCCDKDPLYSFHYHKNSRSYALQQPGSKQVDHAGYPLHFDLQKKSCLRIEGHLGVHPKTVLSNLKRIKSDHNLDFDILFLFLGNTLPDEDDQPLDYRPKIFNRWVRRHPGLEHCGCVGFGETLVLIVDPHCPGFSDDVIVADFTLPYRASCCEADNRSRKPELPYKREDASLIVEVRNDQGGIVPEMTLYLLNEGRIEEELESLDYIDPSVSTTYQTTFRGENGYSPQDEFDLFGIRDECEDVEGEPTSSSFYYIGLSKGLRPTVDGPPCILTVGKVGPPETVVGHGQLVFEVVAPEGYDVDGTTVTINSINSIDNHRATRIINDSDHPRTKVVRFDVDGDAGLATMYLGEKFIVDAQKVVTDEAGNVLVTLVDTYDTVVVEETATGEETCIFRIYLKDPEAAGYAEIAKNIKLRSQKARTRPKSASASRPAARKPRESTSTAGKPQPGSSTAINQQAPEIFEGRFEAARLFVEDQLAEVSATSENTAKVLTKSSSLKGDKLTAAYTEAYTAIRRAFNQSGDQKKTVYGTLMSRLTTIYLDQLIRYSPDALSAEDAAALEKGMSLLNEANQFDRFVRSWKVEELDAVTNAPVIAEIKAELG